MVFLHYYSSWNHFISISNLFHSRVEKCIFQKAKLKGQLIQLESYRWSSKFLNS